MSPTIPPIRPIGPPEGHAAYHWSLPSHIRYRVISPRNIQLITGLDTMGCAGCHAEIEARHLITYHGHQFCPACFADAAARDRTEANARLARPTFTARVRAHVERTGTPHEIVPDAELAWQNVPEVCP